MNSKFKNKYLAALVCAVLGVVVLGVVFVLPFIFDTFYGDKIITQTLNNVTGNLTDPDQIALSIMAWEKEYFYNPYALFDPNSTFQKFGVYEINGTHKKFYRNAPVSWIIYSRLANCEEYAKTFVYLMNKEGVEARIVSAPAEDHTWAEYYFNGYKIVVDPSANKVISDKKEFAKGKNWSYIESVNIFNNSDKKDVSEEYFERGKLTVRVTNQNKPVNRANVIVKSLYLAEINPNMYKKPKVVFTNTTNKDGKAVFYLGEKQYVVKIEYCFKAYSKNVTVVPNKEVDLNFNLTLSKLKFLFCSLIF